MRLRSHKPFDQDAVRALHGLALDGAGARHPGPWDTDLGPVETFPFDGGDVLVGHEKKRRVAMGGPQRIDETTGETRRMRIRPVWTLSQSLRRYVRAASSELT